MVARGRRLAITISVRNRQDAREAGTTQDDIENRLVICLSNKQAVHHRGLCRDCGDTYAYRM